MTTQHLSPSCKKDWIILAGLALTPVEKTRAYVMLSISALIHDQNDQPFDCKHLNIKKLNHLLKLSVSDKILEIPRQTYHWFWKDELLTGNFYSPFNTHLTLKDVLRTPELLVHHAKDVADILLDKLPTVLKWKLGLSDKGQYYRFRNDVIETFYA